MKQNDHSHNITILQTYYTLQYNKRIVHYNITNLLNITILQTYHTLQYYNLLYITILQSIVRYNITNVLYITLLQTCCTLQYYKRVVHYNYTVTDGNQMKNRREGGSESPRLRL